MGLLDKIKFHAWDNVGSVVTLIEHWQPTGCKTEKDCEKSLIAFLRAELPGVTITPQYANGRMKADLLVGGKVFVEIKKDLKTTSACQRLVGQLSEYSEWKGRILVLLVGETDPDLKMSLDKTISKLNVDLEPKFTLFVKA